jgi:hypothetical protein
MLKYFYDSANGLGNIIAPTPENLDEHLKNDMLYHASYENNSQEVFDLIFVGASPCALNDVGNAAIHVAAREGHLKLVKIFVEANPECINLKGRGGNTPLHYVASAKYITEKHFSIVEFLLRKGADGLIKNDKSKSAYDVCSKRGKYAKKVEDTLDKCLLGYCTWLVDDSRNQKNEGKKKGDDTDKILLDFDINEYKEQSAYIYNNNVRRSQPATVDSKPPQHLRSPSSSIEHISPTKINKNKKRDENVENVNNTTNKSSKHQAISSFLDSYKRRNINLDLKEARINNARLAEEEDSGDDEEEEFVINEDDLKEIEDDNDDNAMNRSSTSYFVEVDGQKIFVDELDSDEDLLLDAEYDELYFNKKSKDSSFMNSFKNEVEHFFNTNDDAVGSNNLSSHGDSTNIENGACDNDDNKDTDTALMDSAATKNKNINSSSNKPNFMKKISNVANQITTTTVKLVNEHAKNINSSSNDDKHLYVNVKIHLNEIPNGLGVQFNQFLRVVAFRPGNKPTILEECGVIVGDLLHEINGNEVRPPLHRALELLKESTSTTKGDILKLRFMRKT